MRTKWLFCRTQCIQTHSLQRSSSDQFLAGHQAEEFVQKVVFASQIVQPLTAPITFLRSRGWDGRLLASRVCSGDQRQSLGTKLLNLSRFNTQCTRIMTETICAQTGSLSGGALFTETRVPVETFLRSNFSFGRRSRAWYTRKSPVLCSNVFCRELFQVWLARSPP